MISIRPIIYVLGYVLVALAAAMLVPAAIDAIHENDDWQAFVVGSLITCFIGLNSIFSCKKGRFDLNLKQSFILTGLTWVVVPVFSTLPLMFGTLEMSFTNALFETMSGYTTTGATVIVGLDQAPHGVLLWRAMLQFFGGIGIIVLAVAILPLLQVGGMQLFYMEFSDKSEKIMPRIADIAGAIFWVYLGLNILCAICFAAAGMSWFDAVCHAFATLSTGGMSTKDSSFAFFNSHALEAICIVFMILGGLPFIMYVRILRNGLGEFFKEPQTKTYLVMILVMVFTLWIFESKQLGTWVAFRQVSFNLVSIFTCTGFASTDYGLWGGLAVSVFMIVTLLGGCAGSSSGGIKVYQIQVLWEVLKIQFKRLIFPRSIQIPYYNHRPLGNDVCLSVMGFFFLYIMSFVLLTVVLCMLGIDALSASSGVAATMANAGPGLGSIIGPVGNYQPLSDAAKWVLSFSMLIGRLEIFVILLLLMPMTWRKG